MEIEKPQYYGIWITPEGINSIFFMELSQVSLDGQISGTIEDRLGEATFVGTKTDDKVNFNKEYIGNPHSFASKSIVHYNGDKIKDSDNVYEGTYTCKDEEGGEDITGTFLLQKFPSSKTLQSLLGELHKKISFYR